MILYGHKTIACDKSITQIFKIVQSSNVTCSTTQQIYFSLDSHNYIYIFKKYHIFVGFNVLPYNGFLQNQFFC